MASEREAICRAQTYSAVTRAAQCDYINDSAGRRTCAHEGLDRCNCRGGAGTDDGGWGAAATGDAHSRPLKGMAGRRRRARRPRPAAGQGGFRRGRRGFRRISGRRPIRRSRARPRRLRRLVRRVPRRRRARRPARRAEPAALAARAQRQGRRADLAGRQERPAGHADGADAVADADIKAIAAFVHDLQAQGSNQGGPPPGPAGRAQHPRRRRQGRRGVLRAPSAAPATRPAGDLQGIATRACQTRRRCRTCGSPAAAPSARGGGAARPAGVAIAPSPTATVTLPSGENGRRPRCCGSTTSS